MWTTPLQQRLWALCTPQHSQHPPCGRHVLFSQPPPLQPLLPPLRATAAQGLQQWVQMQVSEGDLAAATQRAPSNATATEPPPALHDLDMQLLEQLVAAIRQPVEQDTKAHHGGGAGSKQRRRGSNRSHHHHHRTPPVNVAAMEQVLDQASPDVEQLSRLVSYLAKEHMHNTLLPITRWSLSTPARRARYATGCLLHTRIMHVLSGKANTARIALSVFGELRAAGVEPDLVCFNAAISAAGRSGDVESALDIWQTLQSTPNMHPDVFSYTALITAYGRVGQWDDAITCFDDMEQHGVRPNVVTYTSLITLLQRAGQHQRAVSLFTQMERAGVAADVTAYNSAMAACARSRDWQRAWALFSSMKHAAVEPNTVSYNTLISACERCGEVDRANEVYRMMKRHEQATNSTRVTPNTITMNTLINASAKAGRYEEAVGRLDELTGKGVQPDAFTLSALMTACDRGERPQEAPLLWCRLVEAHGVQPNTVTFNALMHAVAGSGDWHKALQLFQLMQQDPRFRPDVVSYGCVIRACERAGQWAMALEIFDEMVEGGLKPNARVFRSVIGACEKGEQWARAIDLFKLMQEMDISLDNMGMLVRRVAYSWPPLFDYLPTPVVKAAIVTVKTGQAARRWVDKATTPPQPEDGV